MAVVKYNNEEIALLARLMRAEAEGDGKMGMLLVGNVGINVLIARYLGQRNSQNVHDALHTSFVLSVIMGIILFLHGFFLHI
mgnify:CR=1 FL=1